MPFTTIVYQERTAVTVKLPKEIQDQVSARVEAGVCVGCGEPFSEGEQVRRGVCVGCYEALRRAVAAGKIDDQGAVRQGLILPPKRPGRQPTNPLAKHFAEMD